ncbi:hypothetical protein H9Q10_00765 [Eikenella sp. S3360]|uniref:Uncharacterized protein n=1 Tax=Eikenella glucosivorans TaxID=2766967 RepID=A0ABS0N7C0_9NEIS|nr:hypothetical protein [Eikenella glucosivorans]MBH5328204.1 hypothetical protein [Eikenella glucosivorans]
MSGIHALPAVCQLCRPPKRLPENFAAQKLGLGFAPTFLTSLKLTLSGSL